VSPARTKARKARSDGSGNRLTRPQPICDPNPISKARSGSSQRAGGEQGAPVFPVLENNFLVFADYLWLPVSRAHNNDLGSPMARYFVIHDTSGPNYGHRPFPDDINENPKLNNLRNFYCPDGWGKAHVFISRTGELLVGHDYSVAWRETKFEQAAEFGSALQGLFLHNELIQPRRSVPGHGGRNDARSPDPAFTTAQYDRLALAYVVASVRAERLFVSRIPCRDRRANPQWPRRSAEFRYRQFRQEPGQPDGDTGKARPGSSREESERARVWDQHYRASGRVPPYTEYPDKPDGPYKRGYWVDSEWPPDYEQQAKAA
jgi:hypothetical protein